MTLNLDWSPAAERDLRRLDHQTQVRVRQALYRFVSEGHGDVARLRGRQHEWRLRVGDVRVLFIHVPDANMLRVLRVLPRGRAYRD